MKQEEEQSLDIIVIAFTFSGLVVGVIIGAYTLLYTVDKYTIWGLNLGLRI